MTAVKRILDTKYDELYCYHCRELIELEQAKVIVGYGQKGGSWGVWHKGCQPEEEELQAAIQMVARIFLRRDRMRP